MESNFDMYKRLQRRPPMTPSSYNNKNQRYNNFKTSSPHSYINGQNKVIRQGHDYDMLLKDTHHKKLSVRTSNYSSQQQQQQQQQQRSNLQKERSLLNMNNTYSNAGTVHNDHFFSNLNAILSNSLPLDRKKYSIPMLNSNNSNATSTSLMNSYTGTLPDWLYNQPPLPPTMSPKPQPPLPPTSSSSSEFDGNDSQKGNHEINKSSLYVKTPEKINETKEPLLPPPLPPSLPPSLPQIDDMQNNTENTVTSPQQQQSSKSKPGKSNAKYHHNNSTGKKNKNGGKATTESTKAKKTISDRYGSYVPKDWSRELAQKALDVESQYIKAVERLPVLLIRFPDPEISREIVSKYSEDICKVIFLQSTAPRYCTVHLKKDSNVTKTIETISKVPFGNGFLHAELKRKATVGSTLPTVDDIDPYTLYVGNLYGLITRNELRNHFPGSSRIDMGYAVCLKRTRYAFIRYTSVDDAIEAFKRTYNTQIGDRTMVIRFRRLNTPTNRDGDIDGQEAYLMDQDSVPTDTNNSITSTNNDTSLLTYDKEIDNSIPNEETSITSAGGLHEEGKEDEFLLHSVNDTKPNLTDDMINRINLHETDKDHPESSTGTSQNRSLVNASVQTESHKTLDVGMKDTSGLSGACNTTNFINNALIESHGHSVNEMNGNLSSSPSEDRNTINKSIKREDDINEDEDRISSCILGKRFDAMNNTNQIKREPCDNEFRIFSESIKKGSMANSKNALMDNPSSTVMMTTTTITIMITTTTTTTSATKATITAITTSTTSNVSITSTGTTACNSNFGSNEMSDGINDTIPIDNLLGKRNIKKEPNEALSTAFSLPEDTLPPPPPPLPIPPPPPTPPVSLTPTLTSTSPSPSPSPPTSTLMPLIKNVKKRTSISESQPSTIKKLCAENSINENSEIICIDDDYDDSDDVMIIQQTNEDNSLEALRQRELSAKEIKKSDVLNDYCINNGNHLNNTLSSTSTLKSTNDDRSAFAKKLYNETRHLEGDNDWESLLWSQ